MSDITAPDVKNIGYNVTSVVHWGLTGFNTGSLVGPPLTVWRNSAAMSSVQRTTCLLHLLRWVKKQKAGKAVLPTSISASQLAATNNHPTKQETSSVASSLSSDCHRFQPFLFTLSSPFLLFLVLNPTHLNFPLISGDILHLGCRKMHLKWRVDGRGLDIHHSPLHYWPPLSLSLFPPPDHANIWSFVSGIYYTFSRTGAPVEFEDMLCHGSTISRQVTRQMYTVPSKLGEYFSTYRVMKKFPLRELLRA